MNRVTVNFRGTVRLLRPFLRLGFTFTNVSVEPDVTSFQQSSFTEGPQEGAELDFIVKHVRNPTNRTRTSGPQSTAVMRKGRNGEDK